jgi:hypothetical protein
MYFEPKTSKYINKQNEIKFNPNLEFEIITTYDGYTIQQDGNLIMEISNNTDIKANMLFCFKYCKVDIRMIRQINIKSLAPVVVPVVVPIIVAPIITPISTDSIETCMSLSEAFGNLQLGSTRKTTTQVWGSSTATKLKLGF